MFLSSVPAPRPPFPAPLTACGFGDPHLPRLLPTLNLYASDDHKIGPAGAYQVAEQPLGGLVTRVLESCEELCGGAAVLKVLKYAVPTYSSINAV